MHLVTKFLLDPTCLHLAQNLVLVRSFVLFQFFVFKIIMKGLLVVEDN